MDNSLIVEKGPFWHRVRFNLISSQNKLTPEVIESLWARLVDCEQDPLARAFIIEGSGGYYSNGMDLVAASEGRGVRGAGGDLFVRLLKRITESSVVVISLVDGKAVGGGVGLAASSDFVFATERSRFSLPELLWGLVPCTIAPFLIRRIGVQACQRMTLSTLPITAELALEYGLVDAIDDQALPLLLQRLRVIAPEGIGRAKKYLSKLWIISDQTLDFALDELESIMKSPEVSRRLSDFAEQNIYPWEQVDSAKAQSIGEKV